MQRRQGLKSVNVGICGLGTVGSGTLNVLSRNADLVNARAACPIRVVQVASRRLPEDLPLDGMILHRHLTWSATPRSILWSSDRGTTVAYELVMEAIANGKHVVTANKALIAEFARHSTPRASRASWWLKRPWAVVFYYQALREGLGANCIQWLAGIINGTTNYILQRCRKKVATLPRCCRKRRIWLRRSRPT